VFKFHPFREAEITFVLTSGGHNAGIRSEPHHQHRHFRIGTPQTGASYLGPDAWLAEHAPKHGSWWSAWSASLAARSGVVVEPPSLGDDAAGFPALEDAPGRYVFMK
jgi:polyhydroxyalkanoate synthase subunit PhaC